MSRRTDEEQDDRESELAEAIERLTAEVSVLRQAVDDLREELTWEIRKLREGTPEWKASFHLTSMPADPAAPDFHQRVNAVDASVFAAPAETFKDLVQRLTSEPASGRLTADDWAEEEDFTPGEVVEIDAAIMDWFAEYMVVAKREPDWFLIDDGGGWFYLLWTRNEKCYLRLLTDEQQREMSRLTGIEPDDELANAEAQAPALATLIDQERAADLEPTATQRSLW